MYAAAGGASLASRQARQRQRQQYNKAKALQQKLALQKDDEVTTPTRTQQSRPFHQLPSNYLRTPHAQGRKLSTGQSTQSKLLLPIVEGNNHQQQQHRHHFEPYTRSPRPSIRPDQPSYQQLQKSATATLPLNLQAGNEATPPATPLVPIGKSGGVGGLRPVDGRLTKDATYSHILPVPQDSIIVTPATPLTSPGHRAGAQTGNDLSATGGVAAGQLERKCSFYRVRRTDAFEHDPKADGGGDLYAAAAAGLAVMTAQIQGEFEDDIRFGLPNGGSLTKWAQQAYYCAYDEDGTYCEHIECAQGRAAWLERGRRCSVQNTNPASCHRRWVKRNRIKDSSLGGSSDDEDLLGVLRGPSSFANAFLYVGLGTVAIGLVIAFVGTGEKGFKTVELRLIGPSLIGIGLICCILRICFCICPSSCLSSNKKLKKNDINSKIDADHTTSLLRGDSKRVSIAKGSRQKFPLNQKSRGNSKMLNEGMEALRQIATTSLFLQNEQKPSTNRIVPIIKEPDKSAEAPFEMKRFEPALNISDITDDEDDDEPVATTSTQLHQNQNESLAKIENKLGRQRLPANQSQNQQQSSSQSEQLHQQTSLEIPETLLMETSLMVVNPIPSTSTGLSILMPSLSAPPPASTSASSPQPSSSRGTLDLPIEKREFLPPPIPLVHTPPPGTSNSLSSSGPPNFFARAGSSASGKHSRSPLATSSMSSATSFGSRSAPATNTTRISSINTLTTKTASQFPTSSCSSSSGGGGGGSGSKQTVLEPELVLSPANLGQ